MEYLILIISGIIGGLIAGVLGLGGGIFYILVLPFIMQWQGIPAAETAPFVVANSLIGIAFASGVSLFSQRRSLKNYFHEVLIIAIAAIVISLLANNIIVHSIWFSKEIFNGFIIILMFFIIYQMRLKSKTTIHPDQIDHAITIKKGIFSGAIAGFVSALSGLGGGIIIIPLLRIKYLQSLKKAKTISLAIILLSSFFISIQNLLSKPIFEIANTKHIGFIIPQIAFPLILGVLIGGPLGVKLSEKLTEKRITYLFILFVLIVLIEKAYSLISG